MTKAVETYSVLVVEDDPDIATGLQDLLQHDGYAVSVANCCAGAMTQLTGGHFNAVLLDLSLPDGDGLDILKTIQARETPLPVIIITAHIAPERTVGSLEHGAFAYLTKPYNREELRQTLRRAIGVQELTAKFGRAEQSLTESEDRFRSLVESASDAIVLANAQGAIVSWNRAAEHLFGYTREEIRGHPLTRLMPARYRQAHEIGLNRLESTGQSHVIGHVVEMHGLTKEGQEFPIELSLGTWKTAQGNYYSGIIRDISWRKLVEQALRASEERLELVIQGSSDGFWDAHALADEPWNSPNTPVWWSPRVREMLGYTEEEFPDVLDSWISRLHPQDCDRVFSALTAHIEHRRPYDVEYRLLTKSGEYHWFRARGQAMWDADGRITRMAGSLQSTMDQRRTQETIRRSEQLLRDIADHTSAVIYVKDLEGRFLFVNRQFEEIFGLANNRIIGRTNHDLFSKDFADAFRSNDLQVLEKNTILEYEEQAPQKDGVHTYLSIKLPLYDQRGRPYATCGISTDITERKRSERLIREFDEQLRAALTTTDQGAWAWSRQNRLFCWSQQVDGWLGITDSARPRSEQEWLDFIHADDRNAAAETLRRAREGEATTFVMQHRLRKDDGTPRWLIWNGDIIRDDSGNPLHIVGVVRLTSPSHPQGTRAEHALPESARRTRD